MRIYENEKLKQRGPGKKKVNLVLNGLGGGGGQPHSSIFLIVFLKKGDIRYLIYR
jgi:hypothetical protein